MVSLLALLPRSLTTFLYAVAALLRFYGQLNTTPIPFLPLTILGWSFLAFALGTAALVVNLGLEWNAGNRSRNREIEERSRVAEARQREIEATERETRRDNLADEEREKADRERNRADRERNRANRERNRADRERNRANRERNRANRERARAASRARIQNRGFILQTRYQLAPSPETEKALADFLSFLQEYGE